MYRCCCAITNLAAGSDTYGNRLCSVPFIYESGRKDSNRYFGKRNDREYEVKDDAAEYFYNLWKQDDPAKVTAAAMSNENLWETDFQFFPVFYNQYRSNCRK